MATLAPDESHNRPVALVTGGAIRIGRGIATALAQSGYDLAIHFCHSEHPAESLALQLDQGEGRALAIRADLTQPTAPGRLIDRVIEGFGRLDALINNAAILVKDDSPVVELARMKLLNVDAPKACLKAAIPHLKHHSGCVVNIADVAGLAPFSRHKAYSRTKAALLELTREKAIELAPDTIRVNAICPGTILPPTSYTPEMTQHLVKQIPLGRLGREEELADAVLFLVRASYITGQTLCVDGGRWAADLTLKRPPK